MSTNRTAFKLESVDRDGAIQETAKRAGLSRRGVLIGSGAGAAAMAFLSAGGVASAATGSASDLKILNFALTLEYLEAAFYAEANDNGALSGDAAAFSKVVAAHEATHVATLTKVIKSLGGAPTAKPTFDFKGTTNDQTLFQKTSLTLESTGVSAYLGQSPLVESNTILGEAAAILAVEARHQAWIADIIGSGTSPSPSPDAFATPLTMHQVLSAVGQTGFITSE